MEELARLDGKPLDNSLPKQLVKSADWETWVDEDEEDIRILDFGEAFLQGNEPKVLAQPGQLRVPELIFTDSFDYRVDLWRAGCMVSTMPLLFCMKYNPDIIMRSTHSSLGHIPSNT